MDEERVLKLVKNLQCSRAEAEQVLADDYAIDHGKKMDFDLPPEKEKIAREMTKTGTRTRKPAAYKWGTRERKPNATKAEVIKELAQFLETQTVFAASEIEIKNAERQIAFTVGSNRHELTLVQKRQPK